MKGNEKPKDARHEVWAIVLFGVSLLLLPSLASYDANDLWINQDPPNSPQHNFIGPLGAWLAFVAFYVLGYTALVIPLAAAVLGVLLLNMDRERSVAGGMMWGLFVIVLSACLLQLFFGTPQSQFARMGAGGWVGSLISDSFLRKFLSRAGSIIVVGTGWMVSLVLLTGSRPSKHALAFAQYWIQRFRNRSGGSQPLVPRSSRLEVRDYLADRGQPKVSQTPTTQKPAIEASPMPRPSNSLPPSLSSPPPHPASASKSTAKARPAAQPLLVGDYEFPPVDLLNPPPPLSEREIKDDLKLNAEILASTLADFNIEVRVGEVQRGPVITRYEICPAPGIKVERISALSNNIALAMKATQVRIQTPIPGKGTVGIEVPNSITAIVYIREILESPEWKSGHIKIPIALGKDISGNSLIADLAEMPHLLIAGATGSGKTVCVNSIITSLLYVASPSDIRFVMIDPKIVEMQIYNQLPHLWMPVVSEAKKVPLALRKLIDEMEHRYRIFAKAGVRNISSFNSRQALSPRIKDQPEENAAKPQWTDHKPSATEPDIPDRLPFIVIFIDELADVMLVSGADVEMAIARLAQLARAVGIHMVLSTQRPSVDVITGVIKANFPARVAFQVASKQDSRVILDANGADKLIGKGDMLYLPPGSSKLIRAQGTYVQDDEIRRTVEFINKRCPPAFSPEEVEKSNVELRSFEEEEDDELTEQCIEVIRQTKRASVSILQRRLRIGYTRAARIMDILEERRIVGPNKGAEPRDILVDLDASLPNRPET